GRLLVAAADFEVDLRIGIVLCDLARQLAAVVDRLAVDGEDRILAPQAGGRRGAVGGGVVDAGAPGLSEPEAGRHVVVDALDAHAEPAAADRAALLERGDNLARRVGGHREGDTDVATGRAVDRGVHADNLSIEVEGRAA